MISKRVYLLALSLAAVALPGAASRALADTPAPPRLSPAMECSIHSYGAFANPADTAFDAYVFSGSCKVNVAPAGAAPVMQKLGIHIESEWAPAFKRASEIVKVTQPGATYEVSTWATCDKDPFLAGAGAICRDQGIGGRDAAYFGRREDVPFAKNKVNAAGVAGMTARAGTRAALRYVGLIKSLIPLPDQLPAGMLGANRVTFVGGPGACPMELDFGDGRSEIVTSAVEPTLAVTNHSFSAAGTYTVTARALPGCAGSATGTVTVTPAPPSGNGTLVAVAVGFSCAFAINGASKGTSSQLKMQLPPGTYSISCKPSTGAPQKTRSVIIKPGETAMAMFK